MKKLVLITISLMITTSSIAQCWDSFALGWDFTLAKKTDGSLWAWGSNIYGKLGVAIPGAAIQDRHKRVTTDQDWGMFSAGRDHSLALKNDGTLWAWGRNDRGQIGDGTDGINFSKDSPVQIGTGSDWQVVGTGNEHSLAIKANGTLWAWGYNGEGRLGDNTSTDRLVPTQIGTGTNWRSVVAGYDHSVGLTNDGKIYTWGSNGFGQLVLGGTTTIYTRYVPTRVGTASNWKFIDAGDSHTIALKNDNTLWVGGNNYDGQLGLGTNGFVQTLVQMGTDTWLQVAAGSKFTIGIKSDGTLWSWGNNFRGQLGNGTTNVNTNVPGQIGTDNDWQMVAAGLDMAMAMKSNGVVYTWGNNSNGQLGTPGPNQSYNVPTAIECYALAVNDFSVSNILKVYPNPASDYVFVQTDSNYLILKTVVSDITGQSVLSCDGDCQKLNIDHLSEGIYFLKVITNKGVFQDKFIKAN